jgi:outer membrane protein
MAVCRLLRAICLCGSTLSTSIAQPVFAQDMATALRLSSAGPAVVAAEPSGPRHPVVEPLRTTHTEATLQERPAPDLYDPSPVEFTQADMRLDTSAPILPLSPALEPMELRSALHDAVPSMPGLRGALTTAIGRDAGLHAAKLDIKVADRQVWTQLLAFTPVVTATFQQSHLSASDGSQVFDLSDTKNYVALSASMPIFDAGGRYYGVKAARSRRDSVVYEGLAARDQATLKFVEYWIQAVSGASDRDLALDTIKRLQRLRSAVLARRNAGFASASDLAQVDADIAAARRTLASIEGSLAKSRDRLFHLSGQRPDGREDLPRFDQHVQGGKDAFIRSARQNNPNLRSAAARSRAELYAARSSMSEFLPSVSLTGEYRRYLDNTRQSSNDDNGLTVGVRLQIPLVNLSSVAETAAQTARKEAALYREVATLDAVEMEVEDLWSDRDAVVAMRKEADREVAARRISAASARSRLEKGFGSLDDAIREESALLNAQRTALQLAAQESVVGAKLLLISGRFATHMLHD